MEGMARAYSFNFDSLEPVRGEEFRQPNPLTYFYIDYMAAFDVVLLGYKACVWWYKHGWWYMRWAFSHWLPWLLQMAEGGGIS